MDNFKPYLAIYNADKNTTISNLQQDLFHKLVFTEKGLTPDLCQAIIDKTEAEIPIIVMDGSVELPLYWFERLSTALNSDTDIQLCSTLTCHVNQLSPLAQGDLFEGTLNQLDQWVYLMQTPSTLFTDAINFQCFMVRDHKVLNDLQQMPFHACNNLVVQSQDQGTISLTDEINIGDQKPLPAHPLSALQWRMKSHLNNHGSISDHCYLLLDKKPVMLHICMNWGGGVHQWINDFCQHENNYQHLILASNGELYRHRHGESLTLHYGDTQGPSIKEYELQSPIKATCITHAEYSQILKTIIDQFQVQQVVVSSIIGHSMECLQTSLPTIRVLHDYFPSWPSLIANLEQPQVSQNDIKNALLQTKNEPFGHIETSDYLRWRLNLHNIYTSEDVQLVAPSQSVVDNMKKIDNSSFDDVVVIPHAIESIKPITYDRDNDDFIILVLGRINPPKGQALLESIIDQLGEDYQFTFLGAGNEGKKYLNDKNISVVMDYDNDKLSEYLTDAQPDIALITSQTSETFNYTLSELQQAGICVVSTRFGALKERIIEGETGFLCDDDSTVIADKIRQLRNNPQDIAQVRSNLYTLNFQNFIDQVAQYRSLIANKQDSQYQLLEKTHHNNAWAKQLHAVNAQKQQLDVELSETLSTLEQRTQWAKKLNDNLELAEHNIALERKEVKHLKTVIKQETDRLSAEIKNKQDAFDQEISRLASEITGLNDKVLSLNALYEETHDKYEDTHKKLQATEISLQETIENKEQVEQQLTSQLTAVNNELTDVYNSRSWRITKPIRIFTTWARHKRNAIKFRWTQLKTIPQRLSRSLKTRGMGGTLTAIKNRFAKKPQSTPKKTITVEKHSEYQAIDIMQSSQPKVSIIIPVYNHFDHTYNCLKSIAALQENTSFEVIVVDDCSTDDTPDLIKNVTGITYHRQLENGGFIESCNTGAKMAAGEYLMFLNNDTVVYDGWLDALCDVFDRFDDAGLVGSQLIYPNDQLQEAGGIVFSDASGWNYGRLGNKDEPWYNHVREVDYCSGASILISSELFTELGYFDERYKPAYYEDTDLAFAVRSIGKKVYLQPASKITHFEGISSGTDLTAGMKKYQVVNQTKFKEKWADALQKQPASGSDIELCRIHGQPPRILIFDACTPTPDQDSGSLRMINLIQILKDLGYHVIFMPENLSHNEAYTEALQQMGVECLYTPHITNPVEFLKDKGKYLDAVILSRYYVAEPVMPFIRQYCPKAQIIFDTVDLHYVRERRMAELENDTKLANIAESTRQKELAVAKACDTTLVVSPYEVEVLAEELPDTEVKVLTNIHQIYGCRKPYEQRKDIMFIGGYQHTPNVDAVEWFVADILPLILKELPTLKFHIIGSKAPKHIEQMANDNIIFHGFVEDIEPFMDDIRIAVAPLRYGAGVKGKVNMSMSYGQPVVGTKVAVEGMYTTEGFDVLMAETPEEFCQQVVRLYRDEHLWNTISQGGLANVENYFSFYAAKQAIKDILS